MRRTHSPGTARIVTIGKKNRQTLVWWLFMGTLVLLCGILAVLQYRWIGEVSIAESERLRSTLRATLFRLSNDFNSRITSACRALLPPDSEADAAQLETDIVVRRAERGDRSRMVRRIGLAEYHEDGAALRMLDAQHAAFHASEWPAEWQRVKERLEMRRSPERWRERRQPGPPGVEDDLVFELPLFRGPGPGFRGPGGPPQGLPSPVFARPEMRWLILELDLAYVRDTLLPEVLQHYLGNGEGLDYQVEVATRTPAQSIIYRSDPHSNERLATAADGSIGLLELRFEQLMRRFLPQLGREPSVVGNRGPGPDMGRWQLFVRHRAGSLDALVTRARRRNLAVTAGVFLLMAASIGALVRFTRNAQRLAQLQMEFVAGVSHELRTPLTALYTAGYNLQGRVANNPSQVTKYGAMIQQESGRLKAMVEQVLRFASAESGRVKQASEPVSVPDLIADSLEASQAVVERWQCVVEQHIEPGLPMILGDAVALKHAIGNLVSNAARYGAGESRWIGISAVSAKGQSAVEIRVADRGPGIPREEQGRVFDAYFRGQRALEDQVQGTGLGLNLVKRIVEAHGGEVALKSEPAQGAEFLLRLPAAPQEAIDEFAHSAGRG